MLRQVTDLCRPENLSIKSCMCLISYQNQISCLFKNSKPNFIYYHPISLSSTPSLHRCLLSRCRRVAVSWQIFLPLRKWVEMRDLRALFCMKFVDNVSSRHIWRQRAFCVRARVCVCVCVCACVCEGNDTGVMVQNRPVDSTTLLYGFLFYEDMCNSWWWWWWWWYLIKSVKKMIKWISEINIYRINTIILFSFEKRRIYCRHKLIKNDIWREQKENTN